MGRVAHVLQQRVPLDMIRRVASIEFFIISIAFMQVSVAEAGPLSFLVLTPTSFLIPPALALLDLLVGWVPRSEVQRPLELP
ncbi:hypothetical protein [Pseudoclavibacter helvolus]|uniref:hypothetical protein n=1 Tax=Pseudoclavibacter helvolus TaxID=255205 RepID=UPI0024ACE385|nr:hypothetical protein [Pseudoclavibacter helvolus]